MIHMIESTNKDRTMEYNAFCRMITFTVFSEIGTSASKIRENYK